MNTVKRFEAIKRQAIDGKEYWCIYDNKENKFSTFTCFGKYRNKKSADFAIKFFQKNWNL